MRVLDWLFRALMLAFAGLVTLSILGAIDAVSTRGGPGGFMAERIDGPSPLQEDGPAAPRPAAEAGEDGNAAMSLGVAAEAASEREKEERWLEAIAYALLALAGLFAIVLLLLASAARDLRRIADALNERRR